jgi:hypothetical protein
MLYNQTNQSNGIPMPLLMGYTHPSPIQQTVNHLYEIYDPISQTKAYDMRTVGTKCLSTSEGTKKSGAIHYGDTKNIIDDSKEV